MTNIKTEPLESPGFKRLKERLGEEGFEALRQDTLRRQQEALEGIRLDCTCGAAASNKRLRSHAPECPSYRPKTEPIVADPFHEIARNIIKGKRK